MKLSCLLYHTVDTATRGNWQAKPLCLRHNRTNGRRDFRSIQKQWIKCRVPHVRRWDGKYPCQVTLNYPGSDRNILKTSATFTARNWTPNHVTEATNDLPVHSILINTLTPRKTGTSKKWPSWSMMVPWYCNLGKEGSGSSGDGKSALLNSCTCAVVGGRRQNGEETNEVPRNLEKVHRSSSQASQPLSFLW